MDISKENSFYNLDEITTFLEINAKMLSELEIEKKSLNSNLKINKKELKNFEKLEKNLVKKRQKSDLIKKEKEEFFLKLKKDFEKDQKILKNDHDNTLILNKIKKQTDLINNFLKSVKNNNIIICKNCNEKFNFKLNEKNKCVFHKRKIDKKNKCKSCENTFSLKCCGFCYNCSLGCFQDFHLPLFLV